MTTPIAVGGKISSALYVTLSLLLWWKKWSLLWLLSHANLFCKLFSHENVNNAQPDFHSFFGTPRVQKTYAASDLIRGVWHKITKKCPKGFPELENWRYELAAKCSFMDPWLFWLAYSLLPKFSWLSLTTICVTFLKEGHTRCSNFLCSFSFFSIQVTFYLSNSFLVWHHN